MKRCAQIIIILNLAIPLLNTAHSAAATLTRGECHGILHRDHGSLQIGGGAGEGEAICVVASSEQSKVVLKSCSLGVFCRVRGAVRPCQDSGECVEIERVDRVQKH
jgi:hypothetical protein